jgi:phage anti-repressor protein
MKILENGIIPVYQDKNGQAVNARELHEFLEVGKDFTNWIKDRISKYGFAENEDFVIFAENGENSGRPKTEYILTLDTAGATKFLSISKSMFYKIEIGDRSPSKEVIAKMSKLYNCSIDEIFKSLKINGKMDKEVC